jgi:TPR repeat protein
MVINSLKLGKALLAATALTLISGSAWADLQSGLIKYQSGDYKGALEDWRPLAEKNQPDALFNIGQAYRLGRGVTADAKTALDFYLRAANLGHVAAQGNAGTMLYFSDAPIRDRAKAVEWWQKATANGDPRAQYMLGVLYFNGEDVEKDWPRAYALTSLAQESGLKEAEGAMTKMNQFLSEADKSAAAALLPTLRSGAAAAPAGAVLASNTGTVRTDIAAPTSATQTIAAKAARAPASPIPAMAKPAMAKPAASAPPAPAMASGWRVQLGAFGNEAAARRAWGEFQAAHDALSTAEPYFEPNAAGTVRLQAGGYPDRRGADLLCGKLKAAQLSCFVVKPDGK